MKKIFSLLMAVMLMACMTVSAFAASIDGACFSTDFHGSTVGKEDIPFYTYDDQADKAYPLKKSVDVAHMKSTDTFKFTNSSAGDLTVSGMILTNSDGLGYTPVTGSGVFSLVGAGTSNEINAIDSSRLLDPTFGIEYSKDAPVVIKITVENLNSGSDIPEIAGEFYVVLDDTATDASKQIKFNDVNSENYFYEPVMWAVSEGVTVGTTNTTFSPYNTCTVANIITFMWRANGSPEVEANSPFTDVDPNSYYYKAATWAYSKGIITGNTFNPNSPCTRAMTVDYFWKMNNKPAANANSNFTDVDKSADYAAAVDWALEQGITAGTSNTTFSPDATCTRAQIVTFLYRMLIG